MSDHHSDSNYRETQRQLALSRRRFLKGLGACMAVPAFESLARAGTAAVPAAEASAAAGAAVGSSVATTATGAPLRMAVVYFPNGAIQNAWWPKGEGKDFTLAPTMEPLKDLTNRFQVFGGLDHLNATAGTAGVKFTAIGDGHGSR